MRENAWMGGNTFYFGFILGSILPNLLYYQTKYVTINIMAGHLEYWERI